MNRDKESVRQEIRKAISAPMKTAMSAAYQAGQHPDKPEARGWARIAFHRAFAAAEHAAWRLKEATERREAHRRLLMIRNALLQREAQSTSPNYLVWISAVQFVATELKVKWPPEAETQDAKGNR